MYTVFRIWFFIYIDEVRTVNEKIDELIKAARKRSMTPEAIEAFKKRMEERQKKFKETERRTCANKEFFNR